MKDHVMIKSNKYGLTVYLDTDIPFEELLMDIEAKFRASVHFFEGTGMAVRFENRILTRTEETQIVDVISETAKIQILCILDYDEKTEKMYKRAVEESVSKIPEPDGQFYRGTLRNRQVLESETSIVIIGDIEEGATVVSKGNIVVTGTIYGSAQAGASGNTGAMIAASHMEPERLRIGDKTVKPVIGGSYSWARLL